MTEKEIVDYLKENKNRGVVFRCMPKEVRKWCKKHLKQKELLVLSKEGWTKVLDLDYNFTAYINYAIMLPSSYEATDSRNEFEKLKKYINDKFYELHKKLDSSDDIFESFKLKSKIELLSELIYKAF